MHRSYVPPIKPIVVGVLLCFAFYAVAAFADDNRSAKTESDAVKGLETSAFYDSTVTPESEIELILHEVSVSGGMVFSQEKYRSVFSPYFGQKVQLRDLFDAANEISVMYNEAGYFLTRAIIPPQELDPDGDTLNVHIVEGFISAIEWPAEFESLRRLVIENEKAIRNSKPADFTQIERFVYLLNQLPDMNASYALRPANQLTGGSILTLMLEKKPVSIWNRSSEFWRGVMASVVASIAFSLTIFIGRCRATVHFVRKATPRFTRCQQP